MTTAIEVVSYKLKNDVTADQIQATHQDVNTFCAAQPGFLYRSLSHDDENTWFDIVYWQDMDCAKAAGEAFMASEKCQALSNLIDNTTVVMRHMSAQTEMLGAPAS